VHAKRANAYKRVAMFSSSQAPLHEILAERRTEVEDRWEKRIRGTLVPKTTERGEIVNNLPSFFEELISALRAASMAAPANMLPARSPTAAIHGLQRFNFGFSLDEVVHEYGVLRDCIVEVAREHKKDLTPEEHDILARCLETGVAEAVQRYSSEREAKQHRQAQEHFAFLAHELRNPLAAARYAVALLRERPDANAVRIAETSLSRLGEMIDRVIVEARIETVRTGTVPLQLQGVALAPLLQEILHEVQPQADFRKIRFLVQCPTDAALEGDRRLLRSAIENLVRNAVKFTHDGTEIAVRVTSSEGRFGIEVEDRCGGLPQGRAELLFLPYAQMAEDRSGFGLGLAIARQAVEAHGGSLMANDLPGRGCVFLLTLPRGQPRTSDEGVAKPSRPPEKA
jgi:signal transduction histidine kinase